MKFLAKRASRHAARAAKALRWRVDQLLKMPYKENNFMDRSALAHGENDRSKLRGFCKKLATTKHKILIYGVRGKRESENYCNYFKR